MDAAQSSFAYGHSLYLCARQGGQLADYSTALVRRQQSRPLLTWNGLTVSSVLTKALNWQNI